MAKSTKTTKTLDKKKPTTVVSTPKHSEKKSVSNKRKKGSAKQKTDDEVQNKQALELRRHIKALKDLHEIREKDVETPKNLLDSGDLSTCAVYLLFELNAIPEKVTHVPIVVPLPHPLIKLSDIDVALITRSPQRKWKDKLALEKEDLPFISRVIDIDKMKKKVCCTFQDRRIFMNSHDVFLCDDNVVHAMPGLLGSKFFNTKKLPIAVPLRETRTIASAVLPALNSVHVTIRRGPTTSVKIGRITHDLFELAENAEAVIKAMKVELEDKRHLPINRILIEATGLQSFSL